MSVPSNCAFKVSISATDGLFQPTTFSKPENKKLLASTEILRPGEKIPRLPAQHVYGNGCGEDQNGIGRATVLGTRRDLSKVVTIDSIRGYYKAAVGDIVVGTVVELRQGRWTIDLRTSRNALLRLTGITLPSGVLRMKTKMDVAFMKTFLRKGDALVAEVQQVNRDGSFVLHTRTKEYGRLLGGTMVFVPPYIIARRTKNICKYEDINIKVYFGLNGFIYLAPIQECKLDIDDGSFTGVFMSPKSYENLRRMKMLLEIMGRFEIKVDDVSLRGMYDFTRDVPLGEFHREETKLDMALRLKEEVMKSTRYTADEEYVP